MTSQTTTSQETGTSFRGVFRGPSSRLLPLWLCVGMLLAGFALSIPAANPVNLSPTEWQATTVAKLLPYVRWPEQSLGSSSNEFVVGVLGSDPMVPLLEELLKEVKVLGREVKVKTVELDTEPGRMHVLFVPARYLNRWQEISGKLDPVGVLTVGVGRDFTKAGGVFNLRPDEHQLVVNVGNARKAELIVDAKLLHICVKER